MGVDRDLERDQDVRVEMNNASTGQVATLQRRLTMGKRQAEKSMEWKEEELTPFTRGI